jgi:Zn-dependent peptidase ImmA (M78 family)
MTSDQALARESLRAALNVRRKANIPKTVPICVFDLAQQLGVEVFFTGGNSFEGLYARESSTIVLSSKRPQGRQAFTCAHELAHWRFDHGTRVDDLDLLTDSSSTEERLANFFAGYLLMPPWTVENEYKRRNMDPETADSLQTYTIACQLGVGYETLIQQLSRTLRLISAGTATRLLHDTPQSIRKLVLGENSTAHHMVIVDSFWEGRPIDLCCGDVAVLSTEWDASGNPLTLGTKTKNGTVLTARTAGIGRLCSKELARALFVRVGKHEYEGRAMYRHLEESADD